MAGQQEDEGAWYTKWYWWLAIVIAIIVIVVCVVLLAPPSGSPAGREESTDDARVETETVLEDIAMGTVTIDDTYTCTAWPNRIGSITLPYTPYGVVGNTVTLVVTGLEADVSYTVTPSATDAQLTEGVNTFVFVLSGADYADTTYTLRVTVASPSSVAQLSRVMVGDAFDTTALDVDGTPYEQPYTEVPVTVTAIPMSGSAVAWADMPTETRSTTLATWDMAFVEGANNVVQLLVTPEDGETPSSVWTVAALMRPNPARLTAIRVWDSSNGTLKSTLMATFTPVVGETCLFADTFDVTKTHLIFEWDQIDGDEGTTVTMTAHDDTHDTSMTVTDAAITDLPSQLTATLNCNNGDFQVLYKVVLTCTRPPYYYNWAPATGGAFNDGVNGTSGGTFTYTMTSGGHITDMSFRIALTSAINIIVTYDRGLSTGNMIGIFNYGSTDNTPTTLSLTSGPAETNYMNTTNITLQSGDIVNIVFSGTGFTYTAVGGKPVLAILFD